MKIENIYGVGEKSLDILAKLNLVTVKDILEYYPFRYDVLRVTKLDEASPNETITIKGTIVKEPLVMRLNRSLNRMSFLFKTDGKIINVTIFNRAFYKKYLTLGKTFYIVGKYNPYKNNFTAQDFKFTIINKTRIEPVYHLKKGITNANIAKIVRETLNMNVDIEDYIPRYIKNKYHFINKIDAIRNIHFPTSTENLKKAKLRTIYEELFLFMFKVNYLQYEYTLDSNGLERHVDDSKITKFINNLPFKLTVDQISAVKDIYNDLVSPKRMNRLILGDVGSGKTCVAEIAMYINYLSNYQSTLMAPTEILARQHYEGMQELFKNTNIKIALLVGSQKKSEKNKIISQLKNGEIDILIGTHALINDDVVFKNLGLVVTDEQHRFGVNQRDNLQNKGIKSDILYLSATPIPRTYALTIYGDMDTSIIKTKPNGRKDIITKVVKEDNIKPVLQHMLDEIKAGHQIYVVAPLIEDENGEGNLNDVLKLQEKFNMAFNNKINIDILHGKMKPKDKEEVINKFKNGTTKILISTTVIEVGVDVKNSTMMVIFNAERFGLATLHQLRGRVGRNDLQSYCYLISNNNTPRLKVMEESNDGFYISGKDFELRGEGDLFGTKQSGDMVFKIADIKRDFKILYQCKIDSNEFIKENVSNNFENYKEYQDILKSIEVLD